MALSLPAVPYYFVVDTEAEKNTGWHDGSFCFVKATNKAYVLSNKIFKEITATNTITNSTYTEDNGLVKVSSDDTTAGYLNGKLIHGQGITFTEDNNGGNETLTIATTPRDDGFWRYNAVTHYLEGWVENIKRIEL